MRIYAAYRLDVRLLDFSEEGSIDGDVLDGAGCCSDTEVVSLEQPAEAVTVDEVDRWGAVTGCFLLGIGCECAGSDEQALVATAGHGTAEVPDSAWAQLPGPDNSSLIGSKPSEFGILPAEYPVTYGHVERQSVRRQVSPVRLTDRFISGPEPATARA